MGLATLINEQETNYGDASVCTLIVGTVIKRL